jgi:hypothetical protein
VLAGGKQAGVVLMLGTIEDFTRPQDPKRAPVQVVYVTHSPFLIDKMRPTVSVSSIRANTTRAPAS